MNNHTAPALRQFAVCSGVHPGGSASPISFSYLLVCLRTHETGETEQRKTISSSPYFHGVTALSFCHGG
jgi:hypothetical protein